MTALATPTSGAVCDLHTAGAVLLISCYEMGHQPLSLASPLATLRRAGYDATVVDTSVDALSDAHIMAARLVAIAVPMHTALRLGTHIAERVRALNSHAHICFYGLYAALNADYLLRAHADSAIAGEYEEALLALADTLDRHGAHTRNLAEVAVTVAGVRTRAGAAQPVLARIPFAAPARATLPTPRQYAHLVIGERSVPAGYVEASRGCLHTCSHCPITPVYGGRFFVVPRAVVLADIRTQVLAGVGHITFGDPDFLNGPGHAMALVRALHAEFPDVTFDATIKVEHILERRALFAELGELGCAFVVSAVESLSATVLAHLAKGHTRADVVAALEVLDAAGIPMRPTFVAFTPWTTADDYLELLDFVATHELLEHIDPIQYAIRLLVPPGSALLAQENSGAWLGTLDEANFTYRWSHPDPRMDTLQRDIAALVETAAGDAQPYTATFTAVRARAAAILGAPTVSSSVASERPRRALNRPIPHLSEPWFC